MGFNCKNVVRLAQVFENNGMYDVADIIDITLIRHAQTTLPTTADSPNIDADNADNVDDIDYAKLLDKGLKREYKVVPHNEPITPLRREESFWVYPDGSAMLLRGTHHTDAVYDASYPDGTPLRRDEGFQNFIGNFLNTYSMFSKTYGAIRVFVNYGSLSLTSHTVPTDAQILAIEKIQNIFDVSSIRIEQITSEKGQAYETEYYDDIDSWAEDVRSQVQNNHTEFKKTMQNVDINSVNDLDWRNREKLKLQERYPGKDNEQLRKMYERSAHTNLSKST